MPVGNAAGDAVSSWLNLLSLVTGALFVATGAYLASVFLVNDARRAGTPDLERYFTRRAIVAAVATGALAAVGLVALHRDARAVFDGLTVDALPLVIVSVVCGIGFLITVFAARYVYDGLTSSGLPLVIVSIVCGIAVLVLLRRGAERGARVLAAGAVAAVIWGWAVAQHPYLLPPTLTISDAAAPSSTLTAVLIVFGVAVCVVLPSIGLLFTLVQRNLIEETSQPAAPTGSTL